MQGVGGVNRVTIGSMHEKSIVARRGKSYYRTDRVTRKHKSWDSQTYRVNRVTRKHKRTELQGSEYKSNVYGDKWLNRVGTRKHKGMYSP